MSEHVSVYVTCPTEESARTIAHALLEQRLVACANMLPIRSLYRWEGRVVDEPEVAMFLKTRRALLSRVEAAVKAIHPYEVPCIVAFDLAGGLPAYLSWLDEQTTGNSDARASSRS